MNYLDILPNDIMKIINKKVEKLHIIERRIERKRNKKINREQREIAEKKRNIYEKYVILFYKYNEYNERKKNQDKINKQSEYTMNLRNEIINKFGKYIIEITENIGGEIPFVNVILNLNGQIHSLNIH